MFLRAKLARFSPFGCSCPSQRSAAYTSAELFRKMFLEGVCKGWSATGQSPSWGALCLELRDRDRESCRAATFLPAPGMPEEEKCPRRGDMSTSSFFSLPLRGSEVRSSGARGWGQAGGSWRPRAPSLLWGDSLSVSDQKQGLRVILELQGASECEQELLLNIYSAVGWSVKHFTSVSLLCQCGQHHLPPADCYKAYHWNTLLFFPFWLKYSSVSSHSLFSFLEKSILYNPIQRNLLLIPSQAGLGPTLAQILFFQGTFALFFCNCSFPYGKQHASPVNGMRVHPRVNKEHFLNEISCSGDSVLKCNYHFHPACTNLHYCLSPKEKLTIILFSLP